MHKERKCKICGTTDETKFFTNPLARKTLCIECYRQSRRKLTATKDKTTLEVTAVEALVVELNDNTVMLTITDDYNALWSMVVNKETIDKALERLATIPELVETTVDSDTHAVIKKNSRPVIEDIRLLITLQKNTIIRRIYNDRYKNTM